MPGASAAREREAYARSIHSRKRRSSTVVRGVASVACKMTWRGKKLCDMTRVQEIAEDGLLEQSCDITRIRMPSAPVSRMLNGPVHRAEPRRADPGSRRRSPEASHVPRRVCIALGRKRRPSAPRREAIVWIWRGRLRPKMSTRRGSMPFLWASDSNACAGRTWPGGKDGTSREAGVTGGDGDRLAPGGQSLSPLRRPGGPFPGGTLRSLR